MLVNNGVLAPENIKEKLAQTYAAVDRLPQTLSDVNGIDLYGSIKEELPRMDDCQKLSSAMPSAAWMPGATESFKRTLEHFRERYARTRSPMTKKS